MKFPDLSLFGSNHNAVPGGYVETPKHMMHEVAGDLPPVAVNRNQTIDTSFYGNIRLLAQARLGVATIAAIESAVHAQAEGSAAAPVIPPAAPAAPGQSAYHAAAAVEQESGFWDAEDPEERQLMRNAGWAGDVAVQQPDIQPKKAPETADEFFQEHFQMMPSQPSAPAAYEAGRFTEQDELREAGMANPYVDQTRLMWDAVDAMPDMSPDADSRMADARRQLDSFYDDQHDRYAA